MSNNWITVTESQFPWEREALEFVRQEFPAHEPYRAWANFEFFGDDGSINEVDLLVLTKVGIFLIEIKSRPGTIIGDAGTWTWDENGKRFTDDNPVLLANRKCKKLKSLILRQKVASKFKGKLPRIEPLVFCSAENQRLQLPTDVRENVVLRDREATSDQPARLGVMAAIVRGEGIGIQPSGNIDKPIAKAFSQALEQAGIRPSRKSRKVSDFVIQKLIMEGPSFQDWAAEHVKLEEVKRRIRIYQARPDQSTEERSAIERAALREFQLLETLQHPGILRTHGFTEHELGSAIIFEHYPEANCLRLDHFLAQRGERLEPEVRLDLIRQIANVIRFAHSKRVVHRSLSPQSILVVDIDTPHPKIKIFNWQIGYRTSSSAAGESGSAITATRHLDGLVEDASTAYMAPEALNDTEGEGEHLDLFSLGAIAYHIFSNKAPAQNGLELAEKIRSSKGLQISSVVNGAGECMQLLIQYATHPDIAQRTDTTREFLEDLDSVEQELLMSDEEIVEDPLQARTGDRLLEGLTVIAELGSGASSKAFLVSYDDKEYVLKVACSHEHNDRLRGEGEVLQKLHQHQHIVKHIKTLELGGRVCLLISRAGTETLADRLHKVGRLHAGLLHRFGEDLLGVVLFLDEQGINHRDIKPHNIGVGKVGSGDKLHLTLFDFSLSRTPPDNIYAGTTGYLDPFLSQRKPPQWDLHAERYAAAVTLFELATGKLPKWGDGNNPSVVDGEASIDPEQFSSSVREGLTEFFTIALRRKATERFDNAEKMLAKWRKCFESVEEKPSTHHEVSEQNKLLEAATYETPITEIGLTNTALEALDTKNILTVRDLLLRKPGRLKRMSGIVGDVRREIIHVADILRQRLGIPEDSEVTDFVAPETELDEQSTATASVDRLVARIAKGNPRAGDNEQRSVQSLLGLDESIGTTWPSQAELATHLAVDRQQVSSHLSTAHGRWKRDPLVTRLRQDIASIVAREGGVMSLKELATAVLMLRGSIEEEPVRTRQAIAVVRAAVETESITAAPTFVVRRDESRIVIAKTQALADYAMSVGKQADELADQDPLVPPDRAIERLRTVQVPFDETPLPDSRLLRVAAGASEHAAISSRQEIYPCGMKARRALMLSQGALLGTNRLTISDLKDRVMGRYPESEPLPDRTELDKLLESVGLGFVWDPSISPRGAYKLPTRDPLVSSQGTSQLNTSHLDLSDPTAQITPDVAEARQFDERLERGLAAGTFIAMTVEPRGYERAVKRLTARFPIQVIDIESQILRTLKQVAESKKVKWERVLQADAERGSEDWTRLMKLIRLVMPEVEQTIVLSSQSSVVSDQSSAVGKEKLTAKPVLLIYPGLLARYEQMDLLTRIREHVGKRDGIPGLWMLIATDEQSPMPIMDGTAIPVIGPAEWARIPDRWLRLGLESSVVSNQLSAEGV